MDEEILQDFLVEAGEIIENLDELFDNIFNTILSRYIVKSLNGFKTIKQDVTMRVKP